MRDVPYTEQELEAAKAFLRDRLRNERSMTADIERLLLMYAAYLLTALFGNASDYDIELLIADLVAQLIADAELLAVDEHDRKDGILAWFNAERGGDTIRGRVRKRVETFVKEVMAVYAAGVILGKAYDELLASIGSNLEHPWDNDNLQEVRRMQEEGELPMSDEFTEPHFGKGVPISSLTALDRMLRFAVADAWMWWGHEDAVERGAKGYYVYRGSSYPCDECDSHTGIFYPVDDNKNRPQYHLNCKCYIVYTEKAKKEG